MIEVKEGTVIDPFKIKIGVAVSRRLKNVRSGDNLVVRLVVSVGSYKNFEEQQNTDSVEYEIIKHPNEKRLGERRYCTKSTLAHWAQRVYSKA
jgi:hypothetical protein